jgi:hypothetical protein
MARVKLKDPAVTEDGESEVMIGTPLDRENVTNWD